MSHGRTWDTFRKQAPLRSEDVYGHRELDVYCKILVVAVRAELDVVPALANAAELVGDLLLVELSERLDNVRDVAEEPDIPLDVVPSEHDAPVLLVEVVVGLLAGRYP